MLLIDATDDPAGAAAAWRAFRSNPLHPAATPYAVRVVDRLDERVDLAPAGSTAEWIDEYSALRTMLVQQPVEAPPPLRPNGDAHSMVSLGELAEAGALSFHQSPPTVVGDGAKPMLTVKDIRLGRAPSRHGDADVPGAVITRAGDIAVVARESVVRQCADDGVLLGPGIELLRVDARVIDSRFLAGVLRAALTRAAGDSIDLYEVGFARLPLSEQRGYADAFAKLGELEQAWHRRRTELERLVRIGYEGLSTGRLRPGAESA